MPDNQMLVVFAEILKLVRLDLLGFQKWVVEKHIAEFRWPDTKCLFHCLYPQNHYRLLLWWRHVNICKIF
jgi:hypothetical protein